MMIDLSNKYANIAIGAAGVIAKEKVWKKLVDQKLSVYIQELMLADSSLSVARAEIMAKADPRHLKDLQEAEEVIAAAHEAKAKMRAIELKFEYQRTMESSRRAEMKLT